MTYNRTDAERARAPYPPPRESAMRAGEKRARNGDDCGNEASRAAGRYGIAARAAKGGDEEKKARIVAAAVAEFAAQGYKNANTNRIVKEAGVSKGLLFHYFGSKKALYLYLYDYAMRLVLEEAFAHFDWNERDIFKRWRAGTVIKYDIMRRHGPLFEFILDAYMRADDEVREAIGASTGSWIETAWRNLRDNLDLSLFRDDIDTEKAINILYWTLDGYSRKQMKPSMSLSYYQEHYDALLAGLDGYLDTLRRMMYK